MHYPELAATGCCGRSRVTTSWVGASGVPRQLAVYEHIDGSRTSLSIRYFSAALILFGAKHTFWRYPLRALFATRSKHLKPARTPSSTPDPNHARSTTNPSNSLFYLVKLGTRGVLFALILLYQNERPSGASDGNRTRVICLEGRGFTIKLHSRITISDPLILASPPSFSKASPREMMLIGADSSNTASSFKIDEGHSATGYSAGW